MLSGLLPDRGTLCAVESLTACRVAQRIPDSALEDWLGKFSGAEGEDRRRQLHAPVRPDWRRNSLEPVGLPCGVVAVEHQMFWTGPVAHAPAPQAQGVHQQGRWAYAQVSTGRTVLRSAASTPAIEPAAICAETTD